MEKKADESKNDLISREELRATILEIEHDLLMVILGKDEKLGSDSSLSNDEMAAGMSMVACFADELLDRYAIQK